MLRGKIKPHIELVILSTFLAGPVVVPMVAAAQGQSSACEIVSVKRAAISKENPHGLDVVSKSADDFLESVYDDEAGFLNEINGEQVKAVFCTRDDIIPGLRDFPILATGLPFSISQDFSSSDSPALTLYYKDGAFQYHYAGPNLQDEDWLRLSEMIEIFNLQPHDLDGD